MSNFNYVNFIELLNHELWENLTKKYDEYVVAEDYETFSLYTDGWASNICLGKDPVYKSEGSDRGWDEDKEDFIRTIPQQVLLELKQKRDRLNEIIAIVDRIID